MTNGATSATNASARSAPSGRLVSADGKIKSRRSGEMVLVRRMPDGAGEFADFRGRRYRFAMAHCVECERDRPERCFEDRIDWLKRTRYLAKICWDCRAVERRELEAVAKRKMQVDALANASCSSERRAAIIILASPKWRDREKISEIYAEARRLTEETGEPHDVDHIYPLQSRFCCGLHVPLNLRVMKASDNRSKGATFPMYDSPALAGMDEYEIDMGLQELRFTLASKAA